MQEYVLPDFSPKSTSRIGYIRAGPNATPQPLEDGLSKKKSGLEGEEEQVLFMGNERFLGPELLFNPTDIGAYAVFLSNCCLLSGLDQSGLAETVASVIDAMPAERRGMFWANIGVFGGLGHIDNLGERL